MTKYKMETVFRHAVTFCGKNITKRFSSKGAKTKSESVKVEPERRQPKYKRFKIYRFNPENSQYGKKPYMQEYNIDVNECGPMVLHALEKIKMEQDSSLTFRRSCREGICGSCGMNIDGVNKLACLEKIASSGSTKIYPLPHMYVIKDLIVDFSRFLEQHKRIRPYLIRGDEKFEEGQEYYLQSTGDRDKLALRNPNIEPKLSFSFESIYKICLYHLLLKFLENLSAGLFKFPKFDTIQSCLDYDRSATMQEDGYVECILCACCSTSCPEYWWHGHGKIPNDFLGPAALLNSYRWIIDSRDEGTKSRLDQLRNYYSVYRCHQINNCTKCCPKKLKPGLAIAKIRTLLAGWNKKSKPVMTGVIKSDPLKGTRGPC